MAKGRITKEQLSDSLLNFITQNAGNGASGPSSIEFKKNSVLIQSATNRVAIGIAGFNKDVDLLLVYKNSVYLEETAVYNISSDSLYIECIEGTWNESGTSLFNFVVIKGSTSGNTGSGSGSGTILDGTITKAKLALELQNKINLIDTLDSKTENINSQLEQKAKQEDVNTLSSQFSNLVANNNPTEGNSELIDTRVGSGGEIYKSVGDAVRGFPIKTTYNLFNPYNFYNGYVISTTGVMTANSSYCCTGFMKITPADKIKSSSNVFRIAYYDASLNFLSYENGNNVTSEFTIPTGAYYCRIVYIATVYNGRFAILVYIGNETKAFIPHFVLDVDMLSKLDFSKLINDGTVSTNSLNTELKTSIDNKVNYIDLNKGIFQEKATFKKSNIAHSEFVNSFLDLKLYNADLSKNYIINQIKVNASGVYQIVITDSEYNNICGFYSTLTPSTSRELVTLDELNSSGVFGELLIDWSVLENGMNLSNFSYSSTGLKRDCLVERILDKKANVKKSSYYYGEVIAGFGDSITAQGRWMPQLISYFGSTLISYGVAGSTVNSTGWKGMCTDERINAIATTTKLLFIMGGMNDFIQNTPLGTLSLENVDTTTFYGACNVMFKKLVLRLPTTKLVCMGCTYGTYQDSITIKNTLNLTSVDYGRAMCEMAKLHGIYNFNLGEMCGWNINNISNYVQDETYFIHPSTTGGNRMAEIIKQMLN